MMPESRPPAELDSAGLEQAISEQEVAIAAFEVEFIPLRKRYEALRNRLRALTGERQRRDLEAMGEGDTFRPIPRRSLTVLDVLAGRGTTDLQAPLSSIAFVSMSRRSIILSPDGEMIHQNLPFFETQSKEIRYAVTLAEAKALLDAGWIAGDPSIALNRLPVYYPDTSAPGWVRLDQIYIEQ